MNNLSRNLARLTLGAILAVPLAALAQAVAGPGTCAGCAPGAGSGMGRGRHGWDPASVTQVQGDVVSVQSGLGRGGQGVHLTLAVGTENLEVLLGPSFFLDDQSVQIAKGDRIEVKGSRVTWAGQPAMVAQEIRKGGEVLTLRDAQGVPAWHRGAR